MVRTCWKSLAILGMGSFKAWQDRQASLGQDFYRTPYHLHKPALKYMAQSWFRLKILWRSYHLCCSGWNLCLWQALCAWSISLLVPGLLFPHWLPQHWSFSNVYWHPYQEPFSPSESSKLANSSKSQVLSTAQIWASLPWSWHHGGHHESHIGIKGIQNTCLFSKSLYQYSADYRTKNSQRSTL